MNRLSILSGGAAQGLVASLAPQFKALTGLDQVTASADRRHDCHRLVRCGVTIEAGNGTSNPDNSWPATKLQLAHDFDGGVFEPTLVFKAKLQDFKIREECAMRVLIIAVSVLGILVGADAARAGLSTTTRDLSASVDQAAFTDEANQQTEDQIGLDKAKRRDLQRGLAALGFDTRVNGKFDEKTRAVITRWQEARGYPKTGFLNTLQYQALGAEIVSTAHADSSGDASDDNHPAGRRAGGGAHHRRSGGGPGGVLGGMVGGLFGRR